MGSDVGEKEPSNIAQENFPDKKDKNTQWKSVLTGKNHVEIWPTPGTRNVRTQGRKKIPQVSRGAIGYVQA